MAMQQMAALIDIKCLNSRIEKDGLVNPACIFRIKIQSLCMLINYFNGRILILENFGNSQIRHGSKFRKDRLRGVIYFNEI